MLVKESVGFLDWLEAIFGKDNPETFHRSSALMMCAFLRETRGRGKTVPANARQAICWMEQTFCLTFGAASPDCMRTVEAVSVGKASKGMPAPMLPVELVIQVAKLAATDPSFGHQGLCGPLCGMRDCC